MKKDSKKRVKNSSKKKSKKSSEEKTFIYVLTFLGFLIALFLAWSIVSSSINKLEYEGIKFEKVQEGSLTFYKTTVDVLDRKTLKIMGFNFFLRTNPKDLKKIPFEGEVLSNELVVLNSSEGFNCNGDGIIAVANLVQLYEVDGSKVIQDEGAICDDEERYLFINLIDGEETRIVQDGGMCYTVEINNCEILLATERIILENLVNWGNN